MKLYVKEKSYTEWPFNEKAQVHSKDSSMSVMPSLERNQIVYPYKKKKKERFESKVIMTCEFY